MIQLVEEIYSGPAEEEEDKEEKSPSNSATSKLALNDISPILADNEDYKTTTSNTRTDSRILIRTILRKRKAHRTGRRLNNINSFDANALDRPRSHPERGTETTTTEQQRKMTKVKVYRRKVVGQEEKKPLRAVEKRQQKKKVLLKRKLQKSIETVVELKTRPRTYTYFVTRKNGQGNEEFVSSSTEVRDFTYSETVSKTHYRTDSGHQVMTSLVPTF